MFVTSSGNQNPEKTLTMIYNLHRQKTSGMNAPTATKMGNIAVVSSLSYGSFAFGPLGFRTFLASRFVEDSWAASPFSSSSSGSMGRGGSLGQSRRIVMKDYTGFVTV